MSEDESNIKNEVQPEKYTILTQSEEEFQRQMKSLNMLNFESMVEMTLNEDLLKNNFKTITEILKKQYGLINMCTQSIDQLGNKDSESRLEQLVQGQKDLREMVEKLQRDNENNKNDLAGLLDGKNGKDMEGMQQKGEALENRTNELEELLKALKEKIDKMGENGGDHSDEISKLFEMLEQLKQKQGELGQSGDAGDKDLQAELEKLRSSVDRVKDQLLDKVDCEDFDNMIQQLKNQLGNSEGGQKQEIQQVVEVPKSRDGNRIGQLEGRVKTLEDLQRNQASQLQIIQDQSEQSAQGDQEMKDKLDEYYKNMDEKSLALSNDLAKLQDRMKLVEEVKADKTDLKKAQDDKDKLKRDLMEVINKVKESITNNSQKIEGNTTDIDELKRKQDSANKKFNELQRKSNQTGNGADLTKVQALIDSAVAALKTEIGNVAKKLQDQLDKKDFEEDMLAYQQKIFQKIDEIVGALIKKLANKDDTKKALGYLEKKIAELYLLVSPEDKGKEMDGLLVKRPLFWSCVSCDKDLEQYQGRLGDYKNWKVFPPKETSPERMGRFGVGYAQMMQNRKQNIDKEKEIIKDKDQNQQTATNTNTQNFNKSQGTNGFPDIPTKDNNKQYRKP